MADNLSDNIPQLDVVIDPEKLSEDFVQVLRVIRPKWKVDAVVYKESPIEISRGMLNKMVRCHVKDEPKDSVMVRVVNPAMAQFIDRRNEVKLIKYFHKAFNCAPKILASFQNGFCYEFIEGEILSPKRLYEEKIWKKVAEEFATIHAGDFEDEEFNKKMVEAGKEKFKKIWEMYPSELKDPERNKRFQTEFIPKDELQKEIKDLQDHLGQLGSPIVICHMDPRPENMIWNNETEELHLVDFEAITYNHEALELAIHFTRYAGLSPPDYTLVPGDDFQKKWLVVYLRKYYQLTGKKPDDVTENAINRLHVQVKKYILMSLLIGVLMGPLIELGTGIDLSKLDTMGFSVNSLKEYQATKDQILALQLPEADNEESK